MTLSQGAGELLRLLRRQPAMTRPEVGDLTGWARVTVNARTDELLEAGLLRPAGARDGARGRPAARFEFDPARGQLLIADIGASGGRLARCDLAGRVLEHTNLRFWVGDGPDAVLGPVVTALQELAAHDPGTPLWGVGTSLPGPIEHTTGTVVSPPIMTGWDGLSVAGRLRPEFGVPVLVENDSNAMAWGEHVLHGPDDLLFCKLGTGVGAGIVAGGRILRGARGGAGDLGHTRAEPDDAAATAGPRPLCRCGKVGCVEAYAGGWAIARDLTADGERADSVDDVIDLLRQGNPNAIRRVRDAGAVLGAGLAHAVSLLNPSRIVVGGQLAMAGEHLLAGIRQHVAAQALPLAIRDLSIGTSEHALDAGVTGMADLVAAWVLGPDLLPQVLDLSDAAAS